MAGTKIDQYANIAAVTVAETAADTLTAAKFAFPFSIMDKMGLIISRIEYYFNTPSALNGTLDFTTLALIAGPSVVDITAQNDPLVIDSVALQRVDLGVAATGTFILKPYVKDLSQLPGGGILVAPNPLYGAVKGSGEAAAAGGWIKLFYTYIQMAADEYWQLVESRRIISN
jgi:hypothetical protein